MKHPTCFISYSWDHPAHREWVSRLATDLRRHGIDVRLDQDMLAGASITQFMESSVRDSDYVLIVCTPAFREKANRRSGGVGYESQIVSTELFTDNETLKFIPILRSGSSKTALPSYLQGRLVIDFRTEGDYVSSLEQLLKRMWVKPRVRSADQRPRPPKGANRPARETRQKRPAAEYRGTVQAITDEDFASVVEGERRIPVLVHYWAEWAGPCRMVTPVINELASEYGDRIKVAEINIDENPAIAQRFGIMAIPAMNVFERGQVVRQIVGAKPKSALIRELSDWLERPPEEEEEEGGERQLEDAMALTLAQGRIRLVKVRSDGTYSFVDSEEAMHGLIYLAKSVSSSYAAKVREFEELMNDSYITKAELVAFLEQNPTFLLGGEYKAARSRIFLRQENRPALSPDFLLQPVTGELCDILEVQPPQDEIAVSVGGVSMLSEVVMEAVSKLNAYRDYFEDDQRRVSVEDRHGVSVFRPRLFVLIGRSGRTDPLTRRKLEGHVGNVSLRTWDEVLEIAKRRSGNMPSS